MGSCEHSQEPNESLSAFKSRAHLEGSKLESETVRRSGQASRAD